METTMDLNQRIAQFENMARSDPENEMAHFSLGRAYAEAGRHADAAESYLRCIKANPEMSKAYQMAGDCLIRSGMNDRAAEVLRTGFEVAASKGDLMPRRAIEELLRSIGHEPPAQSGGASAEPEPAAGGFVCRQSGRPGTQLPAPPFKGPVGRWIHENISAQTWSQWIGQGTKVINELRLDLSRDQDSETYDRYMREYLGIDDAVLAEIMKNA